MGARETALNALIACRKDGAWVNAALKDYIARDRLDTRDAALATRLCCGVVQNRQKLDHYLQQLLTGKLKDLHPALRDVLHLGLYQLLLMDKIPQSAAVNESVELARKYCKKLRYAPGLVNAVLRKAGSTELIPPKTWETVYSHPQKLIDLLKESVGSSAMEPMLKANNEAPDTCVQANTLRTDTASLKSRLEREGVTAGMHPWLPDCLVITGTGNLENLPAFREGLFYVQDAAAKLSVLCAGIRPGSRVLDCCAAPGGKSFASAMLGAESIVSCDLHSHKVPLIEKSAARLGISNIKALCRDAREEKPQWREAFDTVICDVPCSGYGIIRKKPDIREKDPDTMRDLPALQLAILTRQAEFVKKGGVLLYSTCTLLRRENEAVAAAFLESHPEFSAEPLELPPVFPKNETGMLTLVPGQYDTDGFFICRLRRKA